MAVLAGCSASVMPEIHNENERLATAQRMIDRGQLAEASDLLRGYILRNAGTAQVDGAILMLGQTLLKQKTWLEAEEQFEKLLKDYPESDSAGSASYLLGEALMGQSRPKDFDQQYTTRAVFQWHEYLRLFPGHWRNPQALGKLQGAENQLARKLVDTGDLYIQLRQFEPAKVYYRRVLEEYPTSLPSADAEYGLAVLQGRQGDVPGAIVLLRDLEQRFPGRPIARRAASTRENMEHWQAEKQR